MGEVKNNQKNKTLVVIAGVLFLILLLIGAVIGYRSYTSELRERTYKSTLKEADSLLQRGEFQKATQKYEKAMSISGKRDKEVLKDLATANLGMGNRGEAKELYGRVAEIDKNDAESRYQLALIYYEEGETSEAIKWAKEAASAKVTFISPRYFLGNVYLGKREYKKALTEFLEILEINPSIQSNREKILKNIGVCYENLGDKKRAVYYYEQALSLNPQDQELRDSLNRLRGKI